MNAEYPPIYDCAETQIVKHIAAISPDVPRPIFPLAFVVKSVHLGDLARFMIAANESDSVWITDLEEKQKEEGLDRVEATIHKVTCTSDDDLQ
jgi:hypothetical protein